MRHYTLPILTGAIERLAANTYADFVDFEGMYEEEDIERLVRIASPYHAAYFSDQDFTAEERRFAWTVALQILFDFLGEIGVSEATDRDLEICADAALTMLSKIMTTGAFVDAEVDPQQDINSDTDIIPDECGY